MSLFEQTNEAAMSAMFSASKQSVRTVPAKALKPAHLSSAPASSTRESPDDSASPSVARLAAHFTSVDIGGGPSRSIPPFATPPSPRREKAVPVPRRPTSPITGPPRIDPTSFPHVFDAIFRHTLSAEGEGDHGTALALRGVCRAFRDRADAYLYAHVIFDDPDRPAGALDADVVSYEVASAVATRLEIRSVHGRLPAVPFYDASGENRQRWLRLLGQHTTVVDYHCAVDAASLAPDLAATLDGKLAHCRRIWPSTAVLPAATIVDYIDITPEGFWTAAQTEDDDPIPTIPPIPPSPHIHLNVVNVIYSARMGYYSIRLEIGERKGIHIAFTFTQRADTGTRSGNTRMAVSFTMCHVMNGPKPFGLLGPLIELLPNLIRENKATALIGLEDIPDILMGMQGVGEMFFNTHIVAQGMVMCSPMEYEMGEHRYIYADQETAAKNWIGIGGIPGEREVAGTKWAVMSNDVMRSTAGEQVVAFESAHGATRVGGQVARVWFPLRAEHTMCPPGATCDAFARFGAETLRCMIAYSTALMPDDLPAVARLFQLIQSGGGGGGRGGGGGGGRPNCVVQ